MPVYLSADVRCCMLGCVLHVMGCTKMMTRWWCEGLHACICTACGGLHHDGDEVQMWGAAWWYMSCMTWAAPWCWLGADVRGCMVVCVLHVMGCTMMVMRCWCEGLHAGVKSCMWWAAPWWWWGIDMIIICTFTHWRMHVQLHKSLVLHDMHANCT